MEQAGRNEVEMPEAGCVAGILLLDPEENIVRLILRMPWNPAPMPLALSSWWRVFGQGSGQADGPILQLVQQIVLLEDEEQVRGEGSQSLQRMLDVLDRAEAGLGGRGQQDHETGEDLHQPERMEHNLRGCELEEQRRRKTYKLLVGVASSALIGHCNMPEARQQLECRGYVRAGEAHLESDGHDGCPGRSSKSGQLRGPVNSGAPVKAGHAGSLRGGHDAQLELPMLPGNRLLQPLLLERQLDDLLAKVLRRSRLERYEREQRRTTHLRCFGSQLGGDGCHVSDGREEGLHAIIERRKRTQLFLRGLLFVRSDDDDRCLAGQFRFRPASRARTQKGERTFAVPARTFNQDSAVGSRALSRMLTTRR